MVWQLGRFGTCVVILAISISAALLASVPAGAEDVSFQSGIEFLSTAIGEKLTKTGATGIALTPFTPGGDATQESSDLICDELAMALLVSDAGNVADRMLVGAVANANDMTITAGYLMPDDAQKLSGLLGVGVIVVGTVMDLGSTYRVNLRLISGQTGLAFSAVSGAFSKGPSLTQEPQVELPEKKQPGIVYHEDFSDVQDALIPSDWKEADGLEVGDTTIRPDHLGSGKCLKAYRNNPVGQPYVIHSGDIELPGKMRFEMEVGTKREVKIASGWESYGFPSLPGFFSSVSIIFGNVETCLFLYDGELVIKYIDEEWKNSYKTKFPIPPTSTNRIPVERDGPLFTVYLNDKRIGTLRRDHYVHGNAFEIQFFADQGSFEVYDIAIKELP